MIDFIDYLFLFFDNLLNNISLVNGISLFTMFFYNFLLITFWVVFTRRG